MVPLGVLKEGAGQMQTLHPTPSSCLLWAAFVAMFSGLPKCLPWCSRLLLQLLASRSVHLLIRHASQSNFVSFACANKYCLGAAFKDLGSWQSHCVQLHVRNAIKICIMQQLWFQHHDAVERRICHPEPFVKQAFCIGCVDHAHASNVTIKVTLL